MPTGYTAKLMESGQSFEEFVTGCAHAFGALVMLRDEPIDAPIPKFEPSPYYTESLAEHKQKLTELQQMSSSERLAYGETAKADRLRTLNESLAKDELENARLENMRKDVLAWRPPSPDHQGLKEFMLEQIQTSMNSFGYINESISSAKSKEAIEFWNDAVDCERRGVEYATEHLAKEIECVAGRNQWVEQLRESIATKETV